MQGQTGQSSRANTISSQIQGLPFKEEWAIINKYKALEFEKMKQREHLIDRQKKQQFRRDLDQQLNSRNNAEEQERQQNKLYMEKLSYMADQERQREETNKLNKLLTRKRIDADNIYKVEEMRNSRMRDGDTGYHLEIGVQSEKQHIQKASHFRKEMMDTLDLQLKQKSEEQKLSKIRNQQMEEEHKKIQQNYFKPEVRKHYSQNQRIFQYYQDLDHQKQLREKELEERFVEQANRRNLQAQIEREKQQYEKKVHTKQVVKETLGQQLKQLHRKRVEQHTTNPEEVTYGFMSSVFEPKYKGYNKVQYKRELQQQAEQQRLKKLKQNHMSDEQYKFNLNQLSKAVIGDYAQQHYLDRSLGAVGNHQKYQLDKLNLDNSDQDVQIIKRRVTNLRNRGNFSTLE